VTRRLARSQLSGEAGMSLVELGVSMVITSLLAVLMVTWFSAGVGSENSHRSYDDALSDLRGVSDRLGKEVRSAGYLTAADATSLSFWLDGDRDGVVEEGETITWAIDGTTMVRTTDDGVTSAVLATNLTPSASGFTYDAIDPADVTRVTITLVATAETRAGGDQLEHTDDIYLRNA
jgi:type II secretory pathway pseudopilin PulG